MLVVVAGGDGAPSVRLEEPHVFTQFHVVAEGVDRDQLGVAIRRSGAGEYDGEYVWANRSFLEREAPSDSAEWLAAFEAMVSYAQSQGWMSDDGSTIRAHVEWR